ncbi:hypothetical protein DCCM_0969 [Desulfocucumis palustris]|uniref:Uncharacterized protein n=1 Tax=Desulfocucumis palustris TaxID=1898651 RepID=A0A2L2XAT8_9FIRM|nr:hypothetical protein [Desulfocucumis palustris]GBF32773.1 hypothetical protein DCCM_0969 [Desulfocucumis palustris]
MEYFARYKNIVENIQQLAGNITALKQKEWEELNRLNEERAQLNNIIINEVEARAGELEEALAQLADYVEKAKKAVAHTAGPDSTTEDILALEPVLFNFQSLLDVASPQMTLSFTGAESPSPAARGDTETAGDLQTPQETSRAGLCHSEALEAEAAAAIDPAPVEKGETPPPIEKKFPPKKTHQNNPAANKPVLSNKKKQKAKNNKPVKEPAKNHSLTIIPTKIVPYEKGDILLEEIKRNVEAIKQGKR